MHPASEVLDFLKRRRGLPDGVVISGGEPLLQNGVEDFAKAVKDLGFSVKLDTNGTFPDRLSAILEAGLADYVAMDIKNGPDKYPLTVGVPGFDPTPIRESAALLRAGPVPYEFRTTLVRELHTAGDLLDIAHWLEGSPRYFLQTFVDSGDLVGGGMPPFTPREMRAFAVLLQPFFGSVEVRGV